MHQIAKDIAGVGRTETQLIVAAPVDRVWDTLTDFERWPECTSLVESLHWTSEEHWVFGSTFKAKITWPLPLTFSFAVTGFQPKAELRWLTHGMGIVIERWTRIEPIGRDTKIHSSALFFASYASELPQHLSELLPRFSERLFADFKSACERIAA
jgi:hypothetical protein